MTKAGRRRVAFQFGVMLTALTAVLSGGLIPAGQAQAQVSALPLQFSDVVIFGTNSVRVDSSAGVTAGHVVVNNASPGPTLFPAFELGIDKSVTTPAGYAIAADSISVAALAVVNGNAFYNNLTNNGIINGSLNTPISLPIFAPLPAFQTAAPGTLDVSVAQNQSQTLAPGSYRDIVLAANSTLTLSAGVYNVRSITAAKGAALLFQNLASDKADVRVLNQVVTGADSVVAPSDGDPLKAAKIIFYVAFASGPTLVPEAVVFGKGSTIKANVYAPNGTLLINELSTATGAFLARDVEIGKNAQVDLETFFTQQAPTITSANATTFTVGQAGTFTVTATGFPTPSITRGGAALPSGVTFVDNGNGTGTLSGTPAAGTGGAYAITFTASNGVPPNAVQNFTLTVNQAPAITSANATTFTVGTAGTFTVNTTGFPAPSIAQGGALPAGVTFVNNGNGTGTLSGTPAAGTGGTYAITFTASNGVSPNAVQNFTLTVNQAPAITSANATTFFVGQAGSFTVTTTGFPTSSIAQGGALPAGVTFVNNGNGTGTLSGTPATGTGGNYAITFTASNGVPPNAVQNFTLTVAQAPTISSANATTFTVGTFGTFTVTTTGFPPPSIARGGAALPVGVTFTDTGNGTGTLSGIPAAGTGGIYAITFTATNAAGSSPTQNFTLTVNQAPAITSANSASFTVGQAGSFTVTTTGFPTASITRGGAALPSGLTFVDNGNGTGTLSGTPAAGTGGVYTLSFTASNGVPPDAVQNPFTLTVSAPPSAVDDGPYVIDANTTLTRVAADPDDLLDNDSRGAPLATITSFGGGSLGGTVTSNAAGTTATFGTGSLVVQSNGEFTFTPETGFTGVFTFQYRLTNTGGTSDATVTIHVRPKATADTFGETVVGNVIVNTATGTVFSVLPNDVFNTPVNANLVSGFSTNGGTVTLNIVTGTFTYNPPAGFQGVDTFAYTITDASGFTSAPATVTVSVSGMIWFVNNNAGACSSLCDGRLTNPFTTLQSFTGVNDGVGTHPANNQNIFVYESATPYTFSSGTLLRTGQKLIGQDATATLASITGVTVPSGSSLPVTNSGNGTLTTLGSTVTLAASSVVRGLTISTGSATGLTDPVAAITGVAVSEVSVTTTTGTAVSLSDTGGTVSLTSVSANGGANGIVLSNTTGSFTVTGTGGACTEATPTCTGGRITGTIGGDDSSATPVGTGIVLNNVENVSLTRMRLDNHSNYAIRGTSVDGFTLDNSLVDGANGTNTLSPFNDGSVMFRGVAGVSAGMTGTGAITNSTIMGGRQRNIVIANSVGTLALTVNNNTIKRTSDAAGDDGFALEADTSANVTVNITNNYFARHGGDHIHLSLINNANVNATITGNELHGNYAGTPEGNHPIGLGQGIFILGATYNGTFHYNVSNNGTDAVPFRGNRQGGAIHVNKGSGSGSFNGKIEGNVIGDPAVVASGSSEASGIIVGSRGTGSHTTLINNNKVRQYFDRGIVLEAGEGSSALDATVTNNTVSDFADAVNSLHGIHSDTGILAADASTACLDVRSNLVATAGNEAGGGADIRVRKGTQAGLNVRIPGLVGTTAAAVDTRITADNPAATTVTVSGNNYSAAAACAVFVPF